MTESPPAIPRSVERLELERGIVVRAEEYWRLLGYPATREPSERDGELTRAARAWFADHGRPWSYRREVDVVEKEGVLRLDGVVLASPALQTHVRRNEIERAFLVAVSAGAGLEQQAQALWQEGKPDEYYFLETLGSAVVEQLIALTNGRICAEVEPRGWAAVAHYSPGYGRWDVSEQVALFELLRRPTAVAWPEPMEVLASGMLRPKKSQLALVGLRRLRPGESAGGITPGATACRGCGLTHCQFRRQPYRFSGTLVQPMAVPLS